MHLLERIPEETVLPERFGQIAVQFSGTLRHPESADHRTLAVQVFEGLFQRQHLFFELGNAAGIERVFFDLGFSLFQTGEKFGDIVFLQISGIGGDQPRQGAHPD